MAGFEGVAFVVLALLGFGAYAICGWNDNRALVSRELLTPKTGWAILLVALVALVVMTVAISKMTFPGEFLHTVKMAIRTLWFPAFVGFLFGVGSGIWVSHFVVTAGLTQDGAGPAHRRWGFALLVLLALGMLAGPLSRTGLEITNVSFAPVSVDFRNQQDEKAEDVSPVLVQSGTSHIHSKASAVATDYLKHLDQYVRRDTNYIKVMDRNRWVHLEHAQNIAETCLSYSAKSITNKLRTEGYLHQPAAIYAELGQDLADEVVSFRALLAENQTKGSTSSEECLPKPVLCTDKRCPDKADRIFGMRFNRDRFLPYYALSLAHLMQLAGNPEIGAELLAEWIDWSLKDDRKQNVPNWYRIRAFIHLSILVEMTHDPLKTHDVLLKGVQLFESSLGESPNPRLRHFGNWARNCTESDVGNDADENEKKRVRENIERVMFTFMSLTDRWVRYAINSGEETAMLLQYAENNAKVPRSCYIAVVPEIAFSQANFLTTLGGLLVSLGSRAHDIFFESGEDLDNYILAQKYLLDALTLLRPLERAERVRILDQSVSDAIGDHYVRHEVREAENYLRRAETALNLR